MYRPLDVEVFAPEECGWVRVGHPAARMWEKPDGIVYVFPPRVPELLQRMRAITTITYPSGAPSGDITPE